MECTFFDMNVVRHRPLDCRSLEPSYPLRMPFLLYGSMEEMHIDHIIVSSPNVQLTATNVKLELADEEEASFLAAFLREGVVAIAETIPEGIMQPFSDENPPSFFTPNASLPVTIYKYPHHKYSQGNYTPWTQLGHPIASGTLALSGNLFVDFRMLDAHEHQLDSQLQDTVLDSESSDARSQDHPIFRATKMVPYEQRLSNSVNRWREKWDAALAQRQF